MNRSLSRLFGDRRRLAALLLVLVLAAFSVGGLARLDEDTTVSSFLPASDPTVRDMQTAARAFGADPVVVLAESSQPRALLGADQLPRLLSLEGRMARLPDVAVVYGPGTLLNQVAGAARNLIASISGTRDRLRTQAEADAKARGIDPQQAVRDATKDFDTRYGGLLVQALPAGLPTLRNADFVNAVGFDPAGNPRPQWRYVIPSNNAVAILIRPREGLDQAGTERLVANVRAAAAQSGLATSRLTVSGSPAIAAELGATVRREIPLVGAVAVALIAACYLLVAWIRPWRRRLVPLLATLSATVLTLATCGWLGRPLSLGVVGFLPILIGIGSDFPAYLMHPGAPRRRILVTSLASALGFAALSLSPLPFVRDLGLALALGVLLAVAVALGLGRLLPSTGQPPLDEPLPAAERTVPPEPAGLALRNRLLVLATAVAVAAVGWVMLPRIPIEASPDRLAQGLPAVADARHTEDLLGSSGEVELLLHGPHVGTTSALDWMRRAENDIELAHGDQLRPIVSLPDLLRFLGPTPTPEQLSAALALLPHYLTSAVLNDDGTQAVISLGVSFQNLVQQRELLKQVHAELPAPPPGTTADIVGLPVAAAKGLELVSRDRYLANLAGVLLAGLVLLLGTRSRAVAGRAVLAAVLATGWGLAGAWLLGIPLSPLSVALGSLTTATACEFSVLLGYAGEHAAGRLRRTVTVAGLAASLGYLALATSRLAIIRDFGLLLAASVLLSLLAAHVVVRLLPGTRPTEVPSTPASRPEPEPVS